MEHDGVAQKIIDTIERRGQEIIDLAEDILAHPELGFKEERTAKVIAEKLEGLGLKVKRGLALTGVKGYLDDGGEGITIGVIGELDAVKSPSHPKADPVTQAAHAPDFVAVDPETAYILPAKIMALTVYSLLKEEAAKSREIKEAFKPKLTGEEYVKYMRSVLSPASSGQSEKSVPLRTAISDIRQACFHFADLYYHFSRVLVEELGPERGKLLIEKALHNRAIERGEKLREKAIAMGVPLNMEGWSRVTDIPFTGWDRSFGRLTCPYAAAWLPRLDKEPWFQEIAQLYCDVNDTQVTESYTGDTSQRITKNVLCGDESCEREYFPIEKKDAGK